MLFIHGQQLCAFKCARPKILRSSVDGPCRDEIQELNTLNAEHADIDVFGANYDRLQGQELQDAIAELDIQFASMMADPAELLAQERPRVLPTTYVLSPNGELHAVLTGPQTEESLLKAMGRD